MSSTRPVEHITDSQSLIADGEIVLFELTPSGGTGVLRFKPDNDVTWLGQLYKGVPLQLLGEKRQSDTGYANPRLVIGQDNIDLSLFKPLIYDGSLDNAKIRKITVLLYNLTNNLDVREEMFYRVKQVEGYNKIRISLLLATYSDSLGFQLPLLAYDQPDFPTVEAI